jgi:SAM-dependent methyltransferase
MENTRHLYTDLAWLWPMWGDATHEYADYCRHVAGLIEQHAERPVKTLLDIGCGGGKNVFNLKGAFQVTGLDLSPTMLAQARELNPECEFIQGDMRDFRLGRTFDAVLMDDAISYMGCLADFTAAFRTAFDHLAPGGILVATPDVTTESFQQNRTIVTPANPNTSPEDLDVVFVENSYDPDPTDEQYEATILYLIRENGRLRIETDHWTLGLFSLDTWRGVLRGTGFVLHEGQYSDGENQYTVFTCVKADPAPSVQVRPKR